MPATRFANRSNDDGGAGATQESFLLFRREWQMNGAKKADPNSTPIRPVERSADIFRKAERHSRRVRVLKIAFPLIAVVASCFLLGYSLLFSVSGGTVDPGSMSIDSGNLVMDNPSLDGFTKENLPYSMTAARARQAIGGNANAIALEEIRATVPINADDQATISAESGTFDRQNDRLTLKNAVTLTTTSGVVARLQSAEVDIGSNELTTDEPVEIDMEGMRVRANTFRADGSSRLIFEDRVRVEFDPKQMRRSQQDTEAEGDE